MLSKTHASTSLTTECVFAGACGLSSHIFYFVHGQKDLYGYIYAQIFAAISFILTACLLYIHGDVLASIKHAAAMESAFFFCLFSSMVVYRLFFHTLCRFPGPFLAKVGNAYAPYMARDQRYVAEQQVLHDKYGPIVRHGPNKISVNTVEAFIACHGPQNQCVKGPAYQAAGYRGITPMAFTADKTVHKTQRRTWEHGLNSKSLAAYDDKVQSCVQTWLDQISSHHGKPMNISHWALLLTFDLMGEIGFSQKWHATRDGIDHDTIENLNAVLGPQGFIGDWAWPVDILAKMNLSPQLRAFRTWCRDRMIERQNTTIDTHDMTAPLLEQYETSDKTWRDQVLLNLEGESIVMAATHTTANTMIWAIYHLAKDQDLQDKLFSELNSVTKHGSAISNSDLVKSPLLEAIINECLRLYPSVPRTGIRMTPPQGVTFNNTFIPAGVGINTPIYCLQRNPLYFTDPNSFIPTRWLSPAPNKLVLDPRAFVPFLSGPYNCVGKSLALAETRKFVAMTMLEYRFELDGGVDCQRFEAGWRDVIFLQPADLGVVFQRRGLGR